MEPRGRGERGGKAALRKKARDERYALAHPQEVEPQPPAEPATYWQPQSWWNTSATWWESEPQPAVEERVWRTSPYHISDLDAHWAENPLLQQADLAFAAAGSGSSVNPAKQHRDVLPPPGAAPSAPVAVPPARKRALTPPGLQGMIPAARREERAAIEREIRERLQDKPVPVPEVTSHGNVPKPLLGSAWEAGTPVLRTAPKATPPVQTSASSSSGAQPIRSWDRALVPRPADARTERTPGFSIRVS